MYTSENKHPSKVYFSSHIVKRANGALVSKLESSKLYHSRSSEIGRLVIPDDEIKKAFRVASKKLKSA